MRFSILLIYTVASLAIAATGALADDLILTVPTLRLENLASHQGQLLTVMYVIGKKPGLSVDDRQLNVSEVKKVLPGLQVSDTLDIPSLKLPQEGFRPNYNFLVFVFHNQPTFYWTNSDGSAPSDPRLTDGSQPPAGTSTLLSVTAISKVDFDKQAAAQGNPSEVVIKF